MILAEKDLIDLRIPFLADGFRFDREGFAFRRRSEIDLDFESRFSSTSGETQRDKE